MNTMKVLFISFTILILCPIFRFAQKKTLTINHFPDDMSFKTFLLNQNNRVIAIGNPILTSQIQEFYFSILFGGHKINIGSFKTKIASSDSMINMGNFSWKGEKERYVLLKNKGNCPLVINSVVTSCGCTTLDYSKEPIRPVESTTLHVKYKAEHLEYFNKTIKVYCNAENSPLKL